MATQIAEGEAIISVFRDLEEIRATVQRNGGPDSARVQDAIDRAQATLRKQARDVIQSATTVGTAATAPVNHHSSWPAPQRIQPPSPALNRLEPLPPAMGRRARSADLGTSTSRGKTNPRISPKGTRLRTKTSGPRRALPRPNRLDPLAEQPVITERDLQDGLFSLTNRGIIPPAADVTPAMERNASVITQKPAPLYDQSLRFERREFATGNDMLPAAIHFDLRNPSPRRPENTGTLVRVDTFSPRGLQPLPNSPLAANSPATRSAQALPALPAPPVEEGIGSATFYTEILATRCESPITLAEKEPELTSEERRTAAAVKIAAHWRGVTARRYIAALRRRHAAARLIQQAWDVSQRRSETLELLQQRRESDRKLHTELMYKLGQDWFHVQQQRRVEVHVCSTSVTEHRRKKMNGYQVLQAAQMGRVFRLLDSKVDVILVAPRALHEDILDYYSKIMQFRGVRNPVGRFQVVVPEHIGLKDSLSLTQGILCSPRALRRLRKLVGGRQAYIVPDVVTAAELQLCRELKLPLLGAGPRNLALLFSKSNMKRLATLAELPIGPWAVDIYDEDEFYGSFAELIAQNPDVRQWVFKIDDERDSRGNAYVEIGQIKGVTDILRQGPAAGNGGPVDAGTLDLLEKSLRRQLPRRATLCNRRAYNDFAAWMAEAMRVGATIQGVPEAIWCQTSVHLQIDPDGATNVLGSSETIACHPFTKAATWYPHVRGNWEVLKETALRMGRVLAGKGLVGFASVDVVFFENPEFDAARHSDCDREPTPAVIGGGTPVDPRQLMFGDMRSPSPALSHSDEGGEPFSYRPVLEELPEAVRADYEIALQAQARDPVSMMLGSRKYASPASRWACWIVDVDARLTDEAAALFPIQFVAQVRYDLNSGNLKLTPEAQAASADDADKSKVDSQDSELCRWAMINHATHCPSMEKMSYQSLFQVAKMKGVSFDLFHNTGCIFNFLDVLHCFFSLLALDTAPEACAKRLAGAVSAIAEGTAPKAHSRAQVAAPRDAPVPTGYDGDPHDGLTVSDVQTALRSLLRQLADKTAKN